MVIIGRVKNVVVTDKNNKHDDVPDSWRGRELIFFRAIFLEEA